VDTGVYINSGIRKNVHSDINEEIIKRNQYTEIMNMQRKNTGNCHKEKTEK
jgi:hypothetical protein